MRVFHRTSLAAEHTLSAALHTKECSRNTLRRRYLALFAAGQRAVCCTPRQWRALPPDNLLPRTLQSAHNVTLPGRDFVQPSIEKLHE